MTRANLGAVRRQFLVSAVLASFAVASFGQVVEKGRTFADLTASHPCATGLTERIARVTDCDAADDVGDGGGAFQCWVRCDGTAPWETVAIGGGGGGLPGANQVTEAMLKVVNACTDEYVLTCETTTGDFEWQAPATGTIGGTLTATDDLAVCTDGTGGSTIGACTVLNLDNLRLDGNTISTTNTNGSLILAPNGSGAVVIPGAYPGNLVFFGDTNTGIYSSAGGHVNVLCDDGNCADFSDQGLDPKFGIAIQPSKTLEWFSGVSTLRDIRLSRAAARTLALTDPAGSGAFFNQGGRVALTADYTNATATMSNITALTVTLVAARKYTFSMVLRLSDSVAGEGLKFDFDGGSATATDFGVNCQVFDSALLLSADATALATDFAVATATGASKVRCDGSFTVNAAGTFIPRAAQNSHSTGTLTVELGSFLNIDDANFN